MTGAAWFAAALAGAGLTTACGPAGVALPGDDGNAAPYAHAGTGGSYTLGATVSLDGAASFDPDGEVVAYRWRVARAPTGSHASVRATGITSAAFTPDIAGTYELELEVEDDRGARAFSDVPVTIARPLLEVDAGPDRIVAWMDDVQLTATVTAAPGATTSATWAVIESPSNLPVPLAGATTLTPSFRTDGIGTYVVQLSVSDGDQTLQDTVTISTAPRPLGRVDHAAYSAALDRIALVRNGPPEAQLSIIDPATGAETSLALGLGSNVISLALHPTGARLAATAYARVAVVDLTTATVEATFAWSGFVMSIVFAPDDRIHATPTDPAIETLLTLDLATGALASVPPFGQFTRAALHPSGTAMYLMDLDGSERLARFGIASAPITLQRQTTVPGLEWPLTFTEDGGSIITGGGLVLRASTDPAMDMTVRGSLSTTAYAAAHSAARHQIAAFGLTFDVFGDVTTSTLTMFDDATLAPAWTNELPYVSGERAVPLLVAYRADGARVYVVSRGTTVPTAELLMVSPP